MFLWMVLRSLDFVSCMPIIEAPSEIVHDFVMMTNEFLAPNGTILACDIIGNKDFQPSQE